jgi:ribonuclease-3
MSFEEKLNYSFKNDDLLSVALTHKSYYFEDPSLSVSHNEKLEFLGDAVLDLVLSEWLMEEFPEEGEGRLSKKRASLVNETVLSMVSRNLDIPVYLKLGKGERLSSGHEKPRLIASAYEAVIGAIFLDSDFNTVRDIAREHFKQVRNELDFSSDFATDYKTRLQETVQSVRKPTPTYEHTHEEGPPHERMFYVRVLSGKNLMGEGSGKSKKLAEQKAAQMALEKMIQESHVKVEADKKQGEVI